MGAKVILVILDGLGWRRARDLLGNLEGWVDAGAARVWKMQAVLPTVSGPCYASIHTGAPPQVHGVLSNTHLHRVDLPDIFSEARRAGRRTGAVTHSFFSIFFQRAPFDPVRDLEVDDESLPIQFGRFYTMTGACRANLAVPADLDLFAQVTMLGERRAPDYILVHTCSPDSISHAYGPESIEMDLNTYEVDAALARFLPRWRKMGYEVMVTADHGHSDRGHHGGTTDAMRDVAFYYFGEAGGPEADAPLCQTQIAPTVLARLGAPIPETMRGRPFLG